LELKDLYTTLEMTVFMRPVDERIKAVFKAVRLLHK
jgi:hypothetical protein